MGQEPMPALVTGWRGRVPRICGAIAATLGRESGHGGRDCSGYRNEAPPQYYKEVEEVSGQEALRGKQLQVHGYVAADRSGDSVGTDHYRFKIATIWVQGQYRRRYGGLVPDLLRSRPRGGGSGDGCARTAARRGSDGIMAKCPEEIRRAAGSGSGRGLSRERQPAGEDARL